MVLPEDLMLGRTVRYGKDGELWTVDAISWDFIGLSREGGHYVLAKPEEVWYGEEEAGR